MHVALLIPAYNVERYLPALLEQAQGQTVPFCEVLVYDDASTDGTADVAEACGARVIRGGVNRGPAFARNRLLEATTAPYVHLHDADDTFVHERFVEVMQALVGPRTAAVCRWSMIYKDGTERVFTYEGVEDWARFFINKYAHLNSTVYPRDFLVEHGGFDDDLIQCDELLMTATMAGRGLRFRYTDEVYALHERRDGSLIDDLEPAEPHEWAVRMCERLLSTLAPDYHRAVAGKALHHAIELQRVGGDRAWIDRALAVARQGGIHVLANHGRVAHLISRFLSLRHAVKFVARRAGC